VSPKGSDLVLTTDIPDVELDVLVGHTLHKIINDREMKDALLLVFANKQDIPGRAYLLFLFHLLQHWAQHTTACP
jgi:hypothetical protein